MRENLYNSEMNQKKPVILCVLDGWGISSSHEKAIAYNHTTPTLDHILEVYPHTTLQTSSLDVGLPEGQMGNSEVGHLNLGAGRVVMQDLPRIDKAIEEGHLKNHPTLQKLIASKPPVCHIMGLFSDGGVHSHIRHILALCHILEEKGIRTYLHGFLDGRDTPPKSAQNYIKLFEEEFKDSRHIQIATLCGRYFAMDRDNRWERTEKAYHLLTRGEGIHVSNWHEAMQESYKNGIEDEFVHPHKAPFFEGIKEGEAIITMNFRADRIRQIMRALLKPDFKDFERGQPSHTGICLGLVEYAADLTPFLPPLFPPEQLDKGLGELVSQAGLKQLRIAETEKYPHVTFFFNGGVEKPYEGETRILIPSPQVATYDLQPEMSAPQVTEKLCEAIRSRAYDFILVNYANADMVGHTGDEEASRQAMQAVDRAIKDVMEATLEVGGLLALTADHGNIELLFDHSTHQKHTAHTTNPVHFVLIGAGNISLAPGRLADVAPTLLPFLGLTQPPEMTSQSLIKPAE